MKSEQAQAAAAIRKELKALYPTVKFSVTSISYAGGDSVHINWDNGPTWEEVENITGKYQYGNFNGMEDIYEYSNNRKDIPQSKYVIAQRHITEDKREEVKHRLEKEYGIDFSDDKAVYSNFRCWPDQVIYRELSKIAF
jgi:hypothetical protein